MVILEVNYARVHNFEVKEKSKLKAEEKKE